MFPPSRKRTVTTPISTQVKMKLKPTPLREAGVGGVTIGPLTEAVQEEPAPRHSRHQHGASSVGDAASRRRGGVLVVAQCAAQQAQVVEGQDQDHHAAEGDAANPPASSHEAVRCQFVC